MGFKKVFINECKSLIKSPKRMFYVLVFPIVLFGFMGAVFFNGVPRDLSVAYIDYDQTPMSAKLVQMLDANSVIKMDKIVANENEAKKLLQQGKVYAFIVIPKDFQQSIHKGLSSSTLCYTNNQFLVPAGLIQSNFKKLISTFSSSIKLSRETQVKVQQQRAVAELKPILTETHILYNPYVNYAYYLLIALFPMLLQMVVMMTTIYVIGVEFKYGRTQKWYKLSGENANVALWGKLLPYTLCLLFVGWWMNYLLFKRIGVPLEVPMLNIVLVTFLLIIVYQFLGVAIASITKDFRIALTIGSGFSAVALSFAAYTFPKEGLPKSIQFIAEIFPFTHFMEYYVKRAIKGISISYSWDSVLAMSLFIIVFILAFPKFIKKLKSDGYEKIS